MVAEIYKIFINPVFGSLIGIAGFAFGVYSHRANRQVKKLLFEKRDYPLIGNQRSIVGDDLKVIYNGQAVPRVTITHIIVWNSGTVALHGRDIVQRDPLRVQLTNDARILKISIARETGHEISAEAKLSASDSATFQFDFLNPKDGMALELVHTGLVSSASVVGKMKGLQNGIQKYSEDNIFDNYLKRSTKDPNKIKNILAAMIPVGIFVPLALIFAIDLIAMAAGYEPIFQSPQPSKPPKWVFLIYLAGALISVLVMFRPRPLGYPSKLDVKLTEDLQ